MFTVPTFDVQPWECYARGSWAQRYYSRALDPESSEYTGDLCGGPTPEYALEAFRRAPRELVETFLGYLGGANDGIAPTYDDLIAGCWLDRVIRAAMGGSDCTASSNAGMLARGVFLEIMAGDYAGGGTPGGGGGGGGTPGNGGGYHDPGNGALPANWPLWAAGGVLALVLLVRR